MGGFFNLFKNLGRASDAKAQKVADVIDDKNSVEFAKQDVEKMRKQLADCNSNIGTLKGEISVNESRINDLKLQIKKHDEDAVALDLAGKQDLAAKHCEAAEIIESQIKSLETALQTHKDVLGDQIKSKEELKSALLQSESEIVSLKAMRDAAEANRNLTQISTSSGTSALADLKRRREAAEKDLIKSRAIKEESSNKDSLSDETEKALGRSGGLSRLERLKAK